jgi:hypothetical protein
VHKLHPAGAAISDDQEGLWVMVDSYYAVLRL